MRSSRVLAILLTLTTLAPAALAAISPAEVAVKQPATEDVKVDVVESAGEAPKVEGTASGAGADAPCPTSTAPGVLTAGVATAGTENAAADCHYKINVPSPSGNRIRAVVDWVGAGDHDVYVKYGAAATASPYVCSSLSTTLKPETCNGATVSAGDYFIRVKWYNGPQDFTLTVFVEPIPPACSLGTGTTALTDGVTATGALDAQTGASCYFVLSPALGQDTVQTTMVPPSGSNFDLYVKKGALPTTTVYDCRPLASTGITETCNVANDGTDVYAMVRRSTGSGTFSITARTFSPCSFGNGDRALGDGVADSASLTADSGAACFFTFTPAAGFDLAQLSMTPASGDFDLYARVGSRPTTSSYGCRSILTGTATESCTLVAEGVTVHVMVLRYSGAGSFTLTATSGSTCSLGPGPHALAAGTGVTASLAAFAGAKCTFSFGPDTAADFARFTMTLTTSDFDLYVKKGALPTTSSYDCRPYLGGVTTEECNQLIEDATPQYAMVRRYGGSGEFTITATNVVIPTLENGVPTLGNAAHRGWQYWKLVVPATNAAGNPTSAAAIAIAGDASAAYLAACAAVEASAPDTCDPLANPAGAACAAAGAANPGTCATVDQGKADACAALEGANPGTCAQIPAAPAALPRPDADLYVRHRAGLPTLSSFGCRSYGYGTADECAFSTDVRAGLAEANTQYGGLRSQLPPEVSSQLPATVSAPPNVVNFAGAGKYFIGVYGYSGPADYAVVGVYA